MPGTTAKGYPYAQPADPLVQWPATSQALAEKVDALDRAVPARENLAYTFEVTGLGVTLGPADQKTAEIPAANGGNGRQTPAAGLAVYNALVVASAPGQIEGTLTWHAGDGPVLKTTKFAGYAAVANQVVTFSVSLIVPTLPNQSGGYVIAQMKMVTGGGSTYPDFTNHTLAVLTWGKAP